MSSFWSGYHGTAIILTQEEFSIFVETYNKQHPDDIFDCEEEGILTEFLFDASAGPDLLPFYVDEINGEHCDGMVFVPYLREDGSVNLINPIEKREQISEFWRTGTRYAIYTAFPMEGPGAFPLHYHSFQDIEQEFQQRVGSYLPENFSLKTRIGTFRYAAFA